MDENDAGGDGSPSLPERLLLPEALSRRLALDVSLPCLCRALVNPCKPMAGGWVISAEGPAKG